MPHEPHLRLGPISFRFLVEAADSGGAVAAFEFTVPQGAKVPAPHFHEDFDETLYGLEGALTFTVEGVPHTLSPGTCLFVPRGKVHGFVNEQPGDARVLAVVTPAKIDSRYFRELAATFPAGGPPNPDSIKAVMAKWGLMPA